MSLLQRKYKLCRIVFVLLGAVICVLCLIFLYNTRATYRLYENDDVAVAKWTFLNEEVALNGSIVAKRSINLSPLAPGRLEKLFIKEGDIIREGSLVAMMKNTDISSLIVQINADLHGSKGELDQIVNSYNRHESMYNKGAVSLELMEQLLAKRQKAEAVYKGLQEKLRDAKRQYADSYIRAPFTGTITKRYAQAGEFVAPATPASNYAGATSNSIAELSSGIEVQAHVTETDLHFFKPGKPVSVEAYAFPGHRFRGSIRSVAPSAITIQNAASFIVKINMSMPPKDLKPGMEVKIRMRNKDYKRRLVIPLAALVAHKDRGKGVYVLQGPNKITFRKVRVGIVESGSAEILQGIQPGDTVLMTNPHTNRGQ